MKDWEKEYKKKVTSIEKAIQHIESGNRVVIGHAAGDQQRYDMIGVAYLVDKISLLINNGNQVFNEVIITDTFSGASSCSAVDIDGDSDIDILGTAYDANEVAIWMQN